MDNMPSKELRHFGIRGMKWGVRRWQNEDGTLTSAGRSRKNQQQHNQTLSYRVGAKRLNKRISKLEEDMTKDMASARKSKQYSVGQRGAIRKETESTLNTPLRVSEIGKKTIRNRTLASLGALSASGAACVASTAINTSVPLVGIPASLISAGIYWYKTTS